MIASRLWQVAGWTMLHYLWVGTVLGLLAFVVRQQLRTAAANVRYLFALGSLSLLSAAPLAIAAVVSQQLAPPAYDQPMPVFTDSAPRPARVQLPIINSGPPLPAASPAVHVAVPPETPTPIGEQFLAALSLAATGLPWLWIFGAPLSFAQTTAGLLGAERLRRQSRPLEDARITEMCRQVAASVKISYHVGVAICDRIAAPILVGILRPMILLPAAALAGWDAQQLEMVLLHELAHVRRYDNLVNLLQRIVESVLFFHPMVWIVSGWVRREREFCCDELVVARTSQPHAYAEILVNLAQRLSQGTLRGPSLARSQVVSSMAERPLVARVRRILKKEEQPMQVSRRAVGLVFAAVLAAAAIVGGHYCLLSNAEDSSVATRGSAEKMAGPKPTAPGEVIEGMVVDERGKPQPGIDVWMVNWKGRRLTAKSDADGRFRLDVPEPMQSAFSVTASDATGDRQGIVLAGDLGPSESPLRLVLKASRAVDARVTDANGNPVAGATVEICDWYGTFGSAATNASGRARLTVPADAKPAPVLAFKAGVGMDYVGTNEGFPAESQSSAAVAELVLNGVMPIVVRVHDPAGTPLAGVKVAPFRLLKNGKTEEFCFQRAGLWATSDAEGRAKFDWLPADLETVDFAVRGANYYYPTYPRFSIAEGGSPNLSVELPTPAQIGGRVSYPDGKPAAGILIQAEGHGIRVYIRRYARTAADGTYRLKVYPNESYIIAVANDQWAATSLTGIALKEGEKRENLDLRLNTGTLVHGTVTVGADNWPFVDERRQPPTLIQCGPEIPDEWKWPLLSGQTRDRYRVRLVRWATTDSKGHYAFRVGPGDYELRLPEQETKKLTVTNQREIVLDDHIASLPPLALGGLVVNRAGRPVPGAIIRCPYNTQVVAGKDGRFMTDRTQMGGCLYARSPGANLAGFKVISEKETNVTIITDKGATLIGRVVDAVDRPVPGVRVYCDFFAPQPQRCWIPVTAETDKEGRYRITALMPGWQGEMSLSRLNAVRNVYEVSKGPKVVVQPGEDKLADTVFKAAASTTPGK